MWSLCCAKYDLMYCAVLSLRLSFLFVAEGSYSLVNEIHVFQLHSFVQNHSNNIQHEIIENICFIIIITLGLLTRFKWHSIEAARSTV